MNPLSSLGSFLTDWFGPLGPLLAVAFLGLLLVLIALPTVMKRQRDRFRELGNLQSGSGDKDDKKKALRRTDGRLDKLYRFAHFLVPQK